MRRSPSHAHPNSYHHDYYAPAAAGAYRPRRLFPHPTTSPTPASNSVITIPVHDSSSPLPPHQQPNKPSTVAITPPAPTLDRASAATRIQSCFRGFAVRRHKPLFHLRSVAAVSRQLEELRSEMETPGFPTRVRTSDKERLRFNESVMALLLRLDAVEGAIPEVRSQRKEATRKAILLQDAIDAIVTEGDEEQPSPNCMEGPSSSDNIANIQVLDTCAGAGPQSQSRPEPMMDLIRTPDIDDAVFAKAFVTDAPSKEVAAEEYCAMLSPNVQDLVQGSVSLTEKGENNSDDSDPAVPADGEIQDDLAFIKLIQNHGTNDSEEGSHAHMSENQPSCLHRSTNPDEGRDVRNGTERMVSNTEASMECLPNEASSGATMISESYCDRLSPTNGQEQQESCLSTSESSVLGGIIDVPSSLREAATAMECGSVCQQPKVNGGMDQGAGSASTIVGQAISPSIIAEEEVAAVSSSERVLLQQLSKDCKQLKSLLAKLLIQSRAQSKAISALGDRLEVLEQQQNLHCQKQQQLCQKAKCKKRCSKKGRAYHSKAKTFKCYDDE